MELSDRAFPVRMRRVAVVTPSSRVRAVLIALAEMGVVDLAGPLGAGEGPAVEALRRLESHAGGPARATPTLAKDAPDLEQLERSGAGDVLAGEVELERRRASAVAHGGFALFVGWAPEPALEQLAGRLEPLDASLIELAAPRGKEPPTMLAQTPAAAPFRPLLDTYGAVPYEDVDPTPFAALTYCFMFGMMFGDVGDGLLIVLGAIALRRTRSPRLRALRRVWPMLAAAGGAAIVFGALYGEFFGPTGVVPTLWLAPLDDPTRLLLAAVVIGGCLLVASHALGIVNRWREGGARLALTAASGVPGLLLLLAGGVVAIGIAGGAGAISALGLALGAMASVPLIVGLSLQAGRGGAAYFEVLVSFLDAILRVLSNLFSFSRLAAFGLMHAAIGKVVLEAATGLTGTPIGVLAAATVFVAGTALAFALEAFVAAVQALRLEYYELFSRVFMREGRPFRPWRLPLLSTEEA
ncbi:MAG: V-type ATPase 116kDa subunit family protein [Solirubrobacteraceae bacterium]